MTYEVGCHHQSNLGTTRSSHMTAAFGTHLKDWRGRRRLSQLDLALSANVSARHVAFLETGRSKPSREMVI